MLGSTRAFCGFGIQQSLFLASPVAGWLPAQHCIVVFDVVFSFCLQGTVPVCSTSFYGGKKWVPNKVNGLPGTDIFLVLVYMPGCQNISTCF